MCSYTEGIELSERQIRVSEQHKLTHKSVAKLAKVNSNPELHNLVLST